jgi:hypothetical protein
LTVTLPLPFRSSRSLGPGNEVFGEPGVVLEVVGLDFEDDIREGWRRRVAGAAQRLGWPEPRFAMFENGSHYTLCFTAPANQLRTARETNEWALCATVLERDPCHWSALRDTPWLANACVSGMHVPELSLTERHAEHAALERLRRLARAEAQAAQAS